MPSPLSILTYPHPTLRQQCADISEVTDDVRRLADDMLMTMRTASGVGLAAPQVGHAIRLLVAHVPESGVPPLQLANPHIVSREGDIALEEGCLSIPEVRAPVKRSRKIAVCGIGMDGREQTVEASDLLAVCLQHEIDHLNGVLFFDHLSNFKRNRLLDKYKKLSQQQSTP